MKLKLPLLILAASLLLSSGCMTRQAASFIKAMGNDHASYDVEFQCIYGNLKIKRVNPDLPQTVVLNKEGITSTSGMQQHR